jgi:hypothetical protein
MWGSGDEGRGTDTAKASDVNLVPPCGVPKYLQGLATNPSSLQMEMP